MCLPAVIFHPALFTPHAPYADTANWGLYSFRSLRWILWILLNTTLHVATTSRVKLAQVFKPIWPPNQFGPSDWEQQKLALGNRSQKRTSLKGHERTQKEWRKYHKPGISWAPWEQVKVTNLSGRCHWNSCVLSILFPPVLQSFCSRFNCPKECL